MSAEKTEEIKFPEQISFADLYKLVKQNYVEIEISKKELEQLKTLLENIKEKYTITSEFDEAEATEISKQFAELFKTLANVIVSLASKGIITEVKSDAKTGKIEIQLFKYLKVNSDDQNEEDPKTK
jgi:hypothetical protein